MYSTLPNANFCVSICQNSHQTSEKEEEKNLKIVKWMKVVSFVRRKNRANLIKIFHRTGKIIRANGAQRSWLAFDVQKVVKLVK